MTIWTWDRQQREFISGGVDGELCLADSWLVDTGRVRALDRHRRRFSKAALELGCNDADSARFWSALINLIPRSGEWFPRVEATGSDDPVLGFRVRPAPARTEEIRVWVPNFTDPRTAPQIKGPDIGLLAELRSQAQTEHGCDEVLLVDEHGYAVESATSSLLWWDGETLCAPHPELAQLPGVTATLIKEEARRVSVGVDYRCVSPEDLGGCEVWLVNALHGIRRVNGWSYGADPAPIPTRFWEWKAWLEVQLGPL